MRLHLRHELPCSPDAFWAAFFRPERNERMYREALGATLVELREQEGDLASGLRRVLYTEQPIDAPGPVRKLMGSTAGTTERGSWDPATGLWSFALEPSKMADKIKINGIMRAEATDTGCIREFEMDGSVRILGLGKIFESFMEKQTRTSQDATAAWLRANITS